MLFLTINSFEEAEAHFALFQPNVDGFELPAKIVFVPSELPQIGRLMRQTNKAAYFYAAQKNARRSS